MRAQPGGKSLTCLQADGGGTSKKFYLKISFLISSLIHSSFSNELFTLHKEVLHSIISFLVLWSHRTQEVIPMILLL